MLGSSSNYIDVEITFGELGVWRVTSFYGLSERNRRRKSWNLIHDLKSRSDFL